MPPAAKIPGTFVSRYSFTTMPRSSRMQDEGVPLMQIAQIVGWDPSQTVLMAKRYGHFSTHQLRWAVEAIDAVQQAGHEGRSTCVFNGVERSAQESLRRTIR